MVGAFSQLDPITQTPINRSKATLRIGEKLPGLALRPPESITVVNWLYIVFQLARRYIPW